MGIRTPDLLIANETLYQLSYTPTTCLISISYMIVSGAKNDSLSIPAECPVSETS